MIKKRMASVLGWLLLACGGCATAETVSAEIRSCAVVVSKGTYADKNWRQAADALCEKHDARLVVYSDDVRETRLELSALMPDYACFVARPDEAGRQFVLDVHRMTRKLDDDPYTDVVWGILTGYDATDALRIAQHAEPLTVRRLVSGTTYAGLGAFDEGVVFYEGRAGVMQVKTPDGKSEQKQCPTDTTKLLVDLFNDGKADCFFTSGHASHRDWQIGYSYKNGQFRCHKGQLFGLDTQGNRHDINSPNPKVYLPFGNCLIGLVSGRDCMVTALLHTGGIYQMAGYTVSTWYGYGGWGIRDILIGQPGRYTFAEAFFFNNQALVHQLETRFPQTAGVEFQRYNIEQDKNLIGRLASRHGLLNEQRNDIRSKDELGLLWDRDTVAFYGDPAWEARLAPRAFAWEQTWSVDGNKYSFVLRANQDGSWPGRPVAALLPRRVRNIKVVEGAELSPVITDNFILLPLSGGFKKDQEVRVVFEAEPMPRPDPKALEELEQIRKAVSLVPEEFRNSLMLTLVHAGDNRSELAGAIEAVNKDQRAAAAFLIVNMPKPDLTSLGTDFLAENIRLASDVRRPDAWKTEVPEDIFLNYVLPYANLNERRDNWRRDFYDRFKDTAWKCASRGEAAMALNREVFKTLNVAYHSTKRPKPDQSPYESVEAGFASCTGLSILLADACRAVGIPARVVGTPLWTDKSGNHTWVEIWDGDWHFLGAAEPGPLDSAWFAAKAAAADPARPEHRIYAASFRNTGLEFLLVWAPSITWVTATDVTQSYATGPR